MLKPQASETRELVNLDGIWRFALDDSEVPEPWSAPLPGTLDVAVPASYNDLFLDAKIRDHVGWVWYQRDVFVPRGWGDRDTVMRFDAATHHGKVYVNNVLVVEHIGGYTPFEVDISDHVQPGKSFRLTVGVGNELSIHTIPPGHVNVVDSGQRRQSYHHDFFNYAGLARSVWLTGLPETRIQDITVTTGIEEAAGTVKYAVITTGPAEVQAVLRDETGAEVARGLGAEGALRVEEVKL